MRELCPAHQGSQFHQSLRPELRQGDIKGLLADPVRLEKLHAHPDDHGFLLCHWWQRRAVPQDVDQGVTQAGLSVQGDMDVPDVGTVCGAGRDQYGQLPHLGPVRTTLSPAAMEC
jgi:hypothetical protein